MKALAWMLAAALLALGSSAARAARAAFVQTPAETQDPPAPAPATAPAADEALAQRTVEAWREALELDLPREVLAEGPPLVQLGGALAWQGEAVALVARALFEAGREEEARALLESAEPDEATRPHVELERARQWIELDELERALRFLRGEGETVRLASLPECWFQVGRAWTRAGEARRAVPYLQRFVELAPRHEHAAAALHMLAQAALAAGDGAAATELAERARIVGRWRAYYRVRRLQIREQPDEPLPRLGLAQLWLEARELEKARAVLEPLVERFPAFASGWFHLGEAQRMQGDMQAATASYDAALERDPSMGGARYNRALIALRDGRRAAARRDLEVLVASPLGVEPRFVQAHLALARLLEAEGEHAAAQARYERYVELGGKEPLGP